MAYCSKCGAEVSGGFCAQCGTRVGPSPPPALNPAGLSDNVASALCYSLLLITGVLFLVLAPYNQNRTIRFHAFQAVFAGIGWLVIEAVVSFISLTLLPIPYLGPAISILLNLAAGLGFLFLWLMLMYKAYNGQRWVLPFIGPLAEKQAYA